MPTVLEKLINLAEAYTESICRPQTWILKSHRPGIVCHKKSKIQPQTIQHSNHQTQIYENMGYSIVRLCNTGILGTLTETY